MLEGSQVVLACAVEALLKASLLARGEENIWLQSNYITTIISTLMH
jgi:hypothetical protein